MKALVIIVVLSTLSAMASCKLLRKRQLQAAVVDNTQVVPPADNDTINPNDDVPSVDDLDTNNDIANAVQPTSNSNDDDDDDDDAVVPAVPTSSTKESYSTNFFGGPQFMDDEINVMGGVDFNANATGSSPERMAVLYDIFYYSSATELINEIESMLNYQEGLFHNPSLKNYLSNAPAFPEDANWQYYYASFYYSQHNAAPAN